MSGLWKSGQFKPGWYYLLACWILGLSQLCGQAQITLNVKDFGAKGDAVQFYANTVSNSMVVTTTNRFSLADVGKTIEVFRVGKPTYGVNSYGVMTNDNQDLIATVTNVLNGTNLCLNVLPQDGITNYIPQVTGMAFATIGTDNTPAISNALAAAAEYTNAVIYIPNGTYLTMPVYRRNPNGYGYAAITLKRGGLHFIGESQNKTILLSRGAWQMPKFYNGSAYDGTVAYRGFLFEIVAPITNDYPLIFENMTWDGGVQCGDLPVHGITANRIDGLGWDEQHSAYLTCDMGNNTGTATHQVLTNISVIHWRGESIKSIDQNTNGSIDIEHCFFGDICATALNVYPRWNIRNNVFSNCWQITEYYQKFYRGTAYFCNNLITNDSSLSKSGYFGNAITVNGGIASASPLIIQSNTIYNGAYGHNIFVTTPAANVSFLDNVIHSAGYCTEFNIGTTGAQGTDCNTNILIAGNKVYDTNKITAFVQFGGSGVTAVDGLTITNNYIHSDIQVQSGILNYGGYYTNVVFENNVFDAPETGWALNSTVVPKMVLVSTNNIYNPVHIYFSAIGTNSLGLAKGPKKLIGLSSTGQIVYLDDSSPAIIPPGAWMEIDNRQNLGIKYNSAELTIYTSEKMTPGSAISLPCGSMLKFYWNGSAWTTNAPSTASSDKPVPPTALRVLN